MPKVKVEGIGTVEFPEGMTREQMEAAILDNFGEQIEQIKSDRRQRDFARQQEVATKNQKEKGFGASFLEGMAQTEEDFALGTALIDLNHDDAKTLLEQEYQQWLDSPAAQDDPSFFSRRGAGKLAGEVLPNIVGTIGAAAVGTIVATPVGGLVAGGATAAGIAGVTTKGATFRNDYYSLRQKGVDPAEAYETARDTSNKSAAISAGIAGVTATVPVGKAVGPASTPVRTAAKVAGTEVAFDAGLGGVESVASDLYAESQGVERGDIVENALRSMTAEALVGAPFAGAQTISAYRKSRADRFVADRTAPPTQRALPAPPERLGLPAPDSPVALLTGPDLTAPSRYLPGPDAVPPMILGGPIIDVDSGKVIDAAEISNVPTALLDERGNVIDLGDQNDAGRTAALDIENLFSDRVSNKRVDPESGKLGFRRTAEDFVDVKPRDPDVDAPTPKPKRELTQTTKPEPPTTRTFQEGYEDIFTDTTDTTKTDAIIDVPKPTEKSLTENLVGKQKEPAQPIEVWAEYKEGETGPYSVFYKKPETVRPTKTGYKEQKLGEVTSEKNLPPNWGYMVGRESLTNLKKALTESQPAKTEKSKGQQLHDEFKEAVREIGGRVSMGVDPIATWKAFKSLVKMAGYHAANGVKSAAEFAKRIGMKPNAAVRQAWEDAKSKIARSPKNVSQAVLNALTGVGEKTRITETVKVLGNSVDEKLTLLRERLNLQDRDSTATKAIRGLVDRFVDLKMLQRTIAAGKKIPDTMNAYLRMEHLQDRVGYLRKQVDEKVMEPFLADMKRLNITPDEIHLYLHARHAEEANGRIAEINPDMPDGGSGMTNKQAADLLEDFAEKGQIPALEQLEKQIRALLQSKLDMEFEGGLIDQDNYDRLSTYYKNYVPLNREAHDDHLTKGNSVKQSNVFRGHKARKGSSKEVVDILSNVFFQYYNTIQQVERNRVMATLGEMVKEFKNDVVFPTGKPTLADQAQTVSYRVAGQERHLRVTNPHLAANLNNLGGASLHWAIQALSAGNRYLSLINTQLAPSFVIPNFLRDLQTAKINLMGEQAEALRKNVIRGAREAFKATWKAEVGTKGKKSYEGEYGQYYKEFSEIGGKIEFFGLQDFERFKKDLDTKFKRGKTRAALDKLRQRAGDINAAVENTMRLSVYVNARKAGVSKLQASSLAKNITVNFSRKGEWSKGLNSWFLFFNAGVQGSYRMAQAIRSKKVQKTVAQIAAFAAAQDIFNNLVSGEDEDGETFYKKIPEHVRERNMIIMNPLGEGYLTIPMPYGFNVFHYFGTNMGRMLRGDISVWDNLGHTTSSVLNAFNPIGGASDMFSFEGLARAASPDSLDVFVNIANNKDWKDDPILPDRNPYDRYDKPDSQRYFGNVSEPSKVITRKLNELTGGSTVRSGIVDMSPETVDHVFAHFFGSMGKDLESVSNLFSGEWGRLPVVKRFVGGQTIYYDQENYYKLRGEAYQADDQIKAYRQEGEVKKLREYAKEAAPLRRILPRIKETDIKIKEVNQRMRRIEASQSMSNSAKEEQLEKLKEYKIQLMKLTRKRFLTLTGNE